MLIAALVAGGLSLMAVALGGAWRDLAPGPVGLLILVAALDLIVSARRYTPFEADVPAEIYIGEEAQITLTSPAAPRGLRARLDWPAGLSGPETIRFEREGGPMNGPKTEQTRAHVPITARQRGLWRFSQIWLLWPSRLGLFEFAPKRRFEHETLVIPNIRLVRSGQIDTTVTSTLYGVKENRAIGEGSEFQQLRDFVKGMDVKSIDWKRSARRRSLVAKELRAERNHHVILALDTGFLMREEIGGVPKIDHAITAALATAWAAALGGDLVGHYAYDVRPRKFAKPEPGRPAFARMRRWASDLDHAAHETNHTLALTELSARTPKRSLIIIFTDFVDATSAELLVENMGVLAKRHLIIFVTLRDPELESIAAQPPDDLDGVARLITANQTQSDRRLVMERLSRLGLTIVDAYPHQVTARLISTYLEIKARERL